MTIVVRATRNQRARVESRASIGSDCDPEVGCSRSYPNLKLSTCGLCNDPTGLTPTSGDISSVVRASDGRQPCRDLMPRPTDKNDAARPLWTEAGYPVAALRPGHFS